MRSYRQRIAVLAAAGHVLLSAMAAAQGASPVTASTHGGESNAGIAAGILDRTFALHLEGVPLREALAAISAKTGARFSYSPSHVAMTRRVSLVADRITVRDALAILLLGTGAEATASATGAIQIEPAMAGDTRLRRGASQPGSGSVTGRVIDAQAREGIAQATVVVDATGYRAISGKDGAYVLRGVPPGRYTVTTRALGYAPLAKPVTVVADSAAHIDFALAAVAATLEQVVTTGAGPQRRVELGNAIAVINADSIAKFAPVTDISDLISGRAPGVEVLASSGMAGDDPAIRIRGRSSITGSNDPIVFVDGVRVDATPSGISDVFQGNNPTPSRLNDLNADEIESIEILRGPSAATEYGTDAANGVIVIKTKHGQVGQARWDVGTAQGISTMPVNFPLQYHSWGHTTAADGTVAPTKCPFVNSFGGPSRSAGTCVLDSITTWQPLNYPSTSLFGDGETHDYNLQFSDGTPRVRYFLSGDVNDALGIVRMPPSEQRRVANELRLAIPYDSRYPNADHRVNLRQQATATIGNSLDVSASAGYLATTQRAPDVGNVLFATLAFGSGYRDSLSGYNTFYSPGGAFLDRQSENVSRVVGGLTANWHQLGWLSLRGTAGLDIGRRADQALLLPGQVLGINSFFIPNGYRSTGDYTTSVYTADVGAVASVELTSRVTSKTSVGVQYYDTRNTGSASAVTNIGIGNPSLNGGSLLSANSIFEQGYEALTLGTYVDETVNIADRLYLTGAARLDAGSSFGTQYNAALYPKASISWVISPEPANLIRLRAAYGQSGVQPFPGTALRLEAPVQSYVSGGFVAGDTVAAYGNVHLRPERSAEIETGADLGFFRNRLTLELTGYVKTTTGALVSVPIEASLGGGSLQENLGEVRNRGLEVGVTGHPIDGRALGVDVTLNGSVNDNKVVTVGAGAQPINQSVNYPDPYEQRAGYPLYGLWAVPMTYGDLNHDGLIEPNEISVGDTATFQGSSMPTRELSLSAGLSLFNHRIRVSTQIDYLGGQKLANTAAFWGGLVANTRDLNSPRGLPLWEQARAVESATDAALFRDNSLDLEDASFGRWRELSVAYLVPAPLLAAIRLRSASVTLAVRNLALWTHYTGPDPEVNGAIFSVFSVAGQPTTLVNHDVASDYGTVPQTRFWVLKIALGL